MQCAIFEDNKGNVVSEVIGILANDVPAPLGSSLRHRGYCSRDKYGNLKPIASSWRFLLSALVSSLSFLFEFMSPVKWRDFIINRHYAIDGRNDNNNNYDHENNDDDKNNLYYPFACVGKNQQCATHSHLHQRNITTRVVIVVKPNRDICGIR